MAKIVCNSELMKNHKQAMVMAAGKSFEALESENKTPVFFSIGDDAVFYVTTQLPGLNTGWQKEDISSVLSEYHNGKPVKAKTFIVSQNAAHTVDVALAVTVENQDYLYLMLGRSNSFKAWAQQPAWTYIPFDAPEKPLSLVIDDLYIAQAHSGEYIVTDILKDPDNGNGFITRYYIDPKRNISGKYWNLHDMPVNLQEGKLSSVLGKKAKQRVDGIYTLGTINNKTELLYVPVYNFYNPVIPPNSTRLSVPSNASSLAAIPAGEGYTGLFVTAGHSLLYYPPDGQNDRDAGIEVLNHPLFNNTKFLRAYSSQQYSVVWGLNEEGYIFYTRAEAGKESTPGSWSVPIPILNNVQEAACYLNSEDPTSSSVLFALLDGNNLVQLIQDPVTTQWLRRNIVLPSTDVNDVLELSTFTSHIAIMGDDNLPLGDKTLHITSTSPVGVYINNEFRILSPDYPVEAVTDSSGTLTILQETHTIGAVCYQVELKEYYSRIDVNPMNKLLEIMEPVKTGEELGNIKVTNENGSEQYLVPKDTPPDQKEAAAQYLQQMVGVSKTLPANGTVKQSFRTAALSAESFIQKPSAFFGISFHDNEWQVHKGEPGMIAMGVHANLLHNRISIQRQDISVEDLLGSSIRTTAGDMFNWLKHIFNEVKEFFIHLVDDVYQFFIRIGDQFYHFILNCINDVVQGVEFIFNKIKVFFQDLIKWLGFLFQWDDILRSHKVLKNTIKLFLEKNIADIGTLKKNVHLVFEDIDNRIKQWADLYTVSDSTSSLSAASPELPGQHSPQANYGVLHMKNGASDSVAQFTNQPNYTSEIERLINTFLEGIKKEEAIFEAANTLLQEKIIKQIGSLSFGEIVKRLVGIIASIIVESIENLVETTLDIIQELVQGIIALLTAPIDIPVISWLYSKITKGEKLSLLDAACLVCAIPGTIISKLVSKETPFPDNETTNKLINAKTWGELVAIVNSTDARMAASHDLKYILILFMRSVAVVSSVIFAFLTFKKAKDSDSKAVSALHGLFFFGSTAPNIAASLIQSPKQEWYVIVNEVIYGITAVEKIVEIFSFTEWLKPFITGLKIVDCILGTAGLIPAIAAPAYNPTTISITEGVSNCVWNVNRMLTPFSKIDGSLPQQIAFGSKIASIVLYAITQGIVIVETAVGAKEERFVLSQA